MWYQTTGIESQLLESEQHGLSMPLGHESATAKNTPVLTYLMCYRFLAVSGDYPHHVSEM